ncbi:DUF4810 domain-containing protein [Chromobacterium sphagni]|uniref:DUF4810 domain-containing protein n=1 Tax=Chromobacterium sphagni TaxID=1903179 RepID=A0A1S1X361_9NEIS|nr:DUF4810 domain-containing protein [Chromobacterium sphagni]OHX13922.1 DUF4810 domain-containing protein [Chromobacterium sphagni]
MNTKKIKQYSGMLALLAGTAVLSACGTAPQTLYQWEGYQPQVYSYLKSDGADAQKQIDVMELGLQKIEAKGNMPPPGYHAHLGLLYASAGKPDQMVQELQTEKKLFPESAAYMDFLLAKLKK